MKKKSLLIVVCLVVMSLGIFSYADTSVNVVINEQNMTFTDAEAFIDDNGYTQLPVRSVSEALGANVGWDEATQTVTIEKDAKVVQLTIGKKTVTVDGVAVELDTEAMIKDDRTFVPLRFVSEAMGAEVYWDGNINTAIVKTAVETNTGAVGTEVGVTEETTTDNDITSDDATETDNATESDDATETDDATESDDATETDDATESDDVTESDDATETDDDTTSNVDDTEN